MNQTVEELKAGKIWNDGILVKAWIAPEKRGSLFIPDFSRLPNDHRRGKKAWRAEIVKFGEKIEWEDWAPHEPKVGNYIWLDPVSYDCPRFKDGDDVFLIVRDDDVLAMEREGVTIDE